jgi:hypothetical protein
MLHRPITGLLCILVPPLSHGGGARLEHGGEEAGQGVRRSSDGFGGAHPGFHPAEKGAYGTLAVVQARGGQPEGRGCPIGARLGPSTQDCAS